MSESENSFDWGGLFTSAVTAVPEITGQYFDSQTPVVIPAPIILPAPQTQMPAPYSVPTWVYAAVPAILVGGFLALKAARK